MDDDKIFVTYGLWVLGCIGYFYFRTKINEASPYVLNASVVEISIVVFLVSLNAYVVWRSRNFMPHVTVNNHSGSILGRPVVINQEYKYVDDKKQEQTVSFSWAIFNVGEALDPVHTRGKLSTLIVPFNALSRSGRNYVGTVFTKRIELKQVPPQVYNYLMKHSSDYNLENIYAGEYSEKHIRDNPDLVDRQLQVEALNSQVNFLRDILENRHDDLAELVDMGKKLSGDDKRWYDFMKRQKTADDD